MSCQRCSFIKASRQRCRNKASCLRFCEPLCWIHSTTFVRGVGCSPWRRDRPLDARAISHIYQCQTDVFQRLPDERINIVFLSYLFQQLTTPATEWVALWRQVRHEQDDLIDFVFCNKSRQSRPVHYTALPAGASLGEKTRVYCDNLLTSDRRSIWEQRIHSRHYYQAMLAAIQTLNRGRVIMSARNIQLLYLVLHFPLVLFLWGWRDMAVANDPWQWQPLVALLETWSARFRQMTDLETTALSDDGEMKHYEIMLEIGLVSVLLEKHGVDTGPLKGRDGLASRLAYIGHLRWSHHGAYVMPQRGRLSRSARDLADHARYHTTILQALVSANTQGQHRPW